MVVYGILSTNPNLNVTFDPQKCHASTEHNLLHNIIYLYIIYYILYIIYYIYIIIYIIYHIHAGIGEQYIRHASAS